MKAKAILFDLDGTLLPMDQEAFTKGYFAELAAALSPLGLAPEALIQAVWAGTKAMVANDGSQWNKTRFWESFQAASGRRMEDFISASDHFYENEFHRAKKYTGENPLAKRAVELARRTGRKVILATNPLFPLTGQATRLSWLGLGLQDFDLVTAYETDRWCKPSPQYYLDICRRMDLAPADCLMIGNDEREDMRAAGIAGMDSYLVTDCRIPDPERPWHGAQGSFAEMLEQLARL